MSTRQTGNARENRVASVLEAEGYSCYPSRGSRGIDVVAIAPKDQPLPHLGIEIGGMGKRLGVAFAKMRASAQCPGMVLLVVLETLRKRRRSLRWYASADGKHGGHERVHDAIEEARTL